MSENEKLISFSGDSSEVLAKISNTVGADVSPVAAKKSRTYSHRHFKIHNDPQLSIDFVLAARNIDKDVISDSDKEKEKHRKEYFHNLKKKRLKISHRYLSIVSKTTFSVC